jgi:hypothetical protein
VKAGQAEGELDELRVAVASRLHLTQADIFGRGLRLSDVLAKSPSARNSIDLLEAFAGAIAEFGLEDRLKLPMFTLDSAVDEVMAAIEADAFSASARA